MNKPDQPESTDNPQAKTPAEPLNHARRRLSKVALATPVIASLAARPALACSVSGFMSGNTSPGREDPRCDGYGCTPGFWKTRPAVWALHTPYSGGTCLTYNGSGNMCQEWQSGGTKLNDILPTGCNPFSAYSNQYLHYLLVEAEKGGGNTLTQIAHYTAAILNAAASQASYGSSVADVQAGLCKAVAADNVSYYTTTLLAKLNERGCMFDAHGNCETNFVTVEQSTTCIPSCPVGQTWNSVTMHCETSDDIRSKGRRNPR